MMAVNVYELQRGINVLPLSLGGDLVVCFYRFPVKGRDFSIEQKGFIPQYKLVTSSATPESFLQYPTPGYTLRWFNVSRVCSFGLLHHSTAVIHPSVQLSVHHTIS